jgi:diacylglycerol kinase family enzyme
LLRDNAKHGKDIMFIVNKGQIFCGYQDCHVNIKFDDGEVQRYETTEAEAGSSEVLFLTNNIGGFVKKLKNSKTVTVEVNFYNHGAEQFKFDVYGLEWSRF